MTSAPPIELSAFSEGRLIALLGIADTIGGADEAARQSSLVLLKKYSADEILALVAEAWPIREAKLRRSRRIRLNLTRIGAISCLTSFIIIGAQFYWEKTTGNHSHYQLWYIPHFIMLIANMISLRMAAAELVKRQHGLTHLLITQDRIEDSPLLIDALNLPDTNQLQSAVKQRLADQLPLLHTVDAPPLDDIQKRTLLRKLKFGLSPRALKNLSQADAAFIAAVLMYFEHEAVSGQSVPKAVLPLLKRFAASPSPEADAQNRNHWRTVQTAAGDCLNRLQVGGR